MHTTKKKVKVFISLTVDHSLGSKDAKSSILWSISRDQLSQTAYEIKQCILTCTSRSLKHGWSACVCNTVACSRLSDSRGRTEKRASEGNEGVFFFFARRRLSESLEQASNKAINTL